MKWILLVVAFLASAAFSQGGAPSLETLLNPYGLLGTVLFIGWKLDKSITVLCYRVKAIEQRMMKRKGRDAGKN